MTVRNHVCVVAVPENPPMLAVPVDLSSQTTLYSGRAFHLDNAGMAYEGVTGANTPIFVAHRGVECPDVRGAKAVLSTATGSLPATASGHGMINGVILQPGMVILTTEYHTTGSYSINDNICVATGSGRFKEAGAKGGTIARVLEEGSGVNVAYNTTRSMLKMLIVKNTRG